MDAFDLFVIGGGSAGLRAARTAARMGARVALAERQELGGECFWAGCVPTKAMIRAAQVWAMARRASEFGIALRIERGDFGAAMDYKDRAVARVGGDAGDAGLGRLGVRYYPDEARFEDPHTLALGAGHVRAERVLIAGGTMPAVPPIPGLREAGFLTNREAVALRELPRRLAILGAGPIGLEFGQVFRRFGAEVTVVERMPRVLPNEDAQVSELLAGYLREEGVRLITGRSAVRVQGGRPKRLWLEGDGPEASVEADEILVAAGRTADLRGMGIAASCVDHTRAAISVDPFLRTSVEHIWAAGDVTGGFLFTHVASFEGGIAAQNALGGSPQRHDTRVVPRATYVDPEVASVGLTQGEALRAGHEVAVHAFSFADLDRAILHGEPRGLVKLVSDARSGTILGAHLLGHEASSIIAEVALAMQHGLPVSAVGGTMHAYPSFPEAVEAAALAPPTYLGAASGVED